jgi:prephenate dehydrogenase
MLGARKDFTGKLSTDDHTSCSVLNFRSKWLITACLILTNMFTLDFINIDRMPVICDIITTIFNSASIWLAKPLFLSAMGQTQPLHGGNSMTQAHNNSHVLSFGFIGLGLIGGTIARAIRRYHQDAIIVAYNPSKNSLDEAVADGVVNVATQSIDESFSDCDYIFLCAPVHCNDENISLIKPYLKETAILTDIGSVKTDIHLSISKAGLNSQFIGGHPMTGSERTKYRNSKAEFLENAYYILTPEKEVPEEKVFTFAEIIRSLCAIPLVLSSDQHDYVTAAVSHVPHVISATLVNLVRDSDTPEGIMKTIAAGGFKDITRISSSSPVMWQQICLTNRDNILKLLDDYIAALSDNRNIIASADSDALYKLFDSARKYRDSFSSSQSGPIQQSFVLHITIADRPHALAQIVDLLADENINIKNLGIVHSREFEEGVLSLELHTSEGMKQAEAVLQSNGYSCHE